MIFGKKCRQWFFVLILCLLLLDCSNIQAESWKPRFFVYFKTYQWNFDFIADKFSLVIWHRHPHLVANLPAIREKNPGITIVMYRELFCILKEETQLAESVGHYDWIMANHPDWFQKDIHGNIVEVPDYPGRFMMDLGNPEWQGFWINETMKDVKDGQWDGVFADDVLTTVKAHQLPELQNYPDDASLQSAVFGFLEKAHAAFRAEGKLLIANVSNSYDYPGLFERWLAVTDGIMEEHWAGDSWTWGSHIGEAQLQAMATARLAGKWYLCMTYGGWDDAPRRDLSLAAYLLGSGENVAWSYRPVDEHPARLPVDPDWLAAIGNPAGNSECRGEIWMREFEGRALFVNPTRSLQEIEYGGEQHVIAPGSFKKFMREARGSYPFIKQRPSGLIPRDPRP